MSWKRGSLSFTPQPVDKREAEWGALPFSDAHVTTRPQSQDSRHYTSHKPKDNLALWSECGSIRAVPV